MKRLVMGLVVALSLAGPAAASAAVSSTSLRCSGSLRAASFDFKPDFSGNYEYRLAFYDSNGGSRVLTRWWLVRNTGLNPLATYYVATFGRWFEAPGRTKVLVDVRNVDNPDAPPYRQWDNGCNNG
jgi:hypothetical protein